MKSVVSESVANDIAGGLPDSRGMLATMYVNDKYKEQRKASATQLL